MANFIILVAMISLCLQIVLSLPTTTVIETVQPTKNLTEFPLEDPSATLTVPATVELTTSSETSALTESTTRTASETTDRVSTSPLPSTYSTTTPISSPTQDHSSTTTNTNESGNIFRPDEDCPTSINANNMSQTQLIRWLTAPCRYDRLERPSTFSAKGEQLPVDVHTRAYVYFLQNLDTYDLQFNMHVLLQLRYQDPRLAFKSIAPSKQQPIMGEKSLRDAIWAPHIFFSNEKDSSILGTDEKDILTSIAPDGTVIISTRLQASLYCWMNLQKFPFDEQYCSTIFESWMYNTSQMVLHWEAKSPVTFDPDLHLTEYVLVNAWSNETIVNADLNDLRHGAFAGNYSSLSFTVHLTREVGFYLMDYFLPSMMIVAASWISFWLQADQSAPRIMLGTSTMLSFITLATSQGKDLPKVSYIKISEVWFLGCTIFIYASLMEYALVNTMWRRKRNLELKKVNTKHVLKTTYTPREVRKTMYLPESPSCPSLDGSSQNGSKESNNYNNFLNVPTIPIITTQCDDDYPGEKLSMDVEKGCTNGMFKCGSTSSSISMEDSQNSTNSSGNGWTKMTPQEISNWIDHRARSIFPLAFLLFNACFWTFVFCL